MEWGVGAYASFTSGASILVASRQARSTRNWRRKSEGLLLQRERNVWERGRALLHPQRIIPCKKDGRARRKFWKEPLGGTKILFCGRGLKCFSLLRDTKVLFCGRGLKCFSLLRDTKILFCGRGLKFFHHKRSQEVPILKQHIILFHIFTAQYLKRTLKLPLGTV